MFLDAKTAERFTRPAVVFYINVYLFTFMLRWPLKWNKYSYFYIYLKTIIEKNRNLSFNSYTEVNARKE